MGKVRGPTRLNRREGQLEALYAQVPRLQPENHRITSPATDEYNCVAWVERDSQHWWEPGFYWPSSVPEPTGDVDLPAYVDLFLQLGFEICGSGSLEPGYLKIALYASRGQFHHVAKQLPSGAWSSKIGFLHDVRHETVGALEDVSMFANAVATVFMLRPHDSRDPMELEETGLIPR